MSEAKQIKIACGSGIEMMLEDIIDLQGNLKELTDEKRRALRSQIEDTGFAFAPHVWKNPADSKHYLIDGHQRMAVVRDMVKDGWVCPPIPVVTVEADSLQSAKVRVLQSVSQYGKVTNQGLFEFLQDIQLDPRGLDLKFDIPNINLEKFAEAFYPLPNPDAAEPVVVPSTEVEQGQFSKLVHTCPKCGFAFGAE